MLQGFWDNKKYTGEQSLHSFEEVVGTNLYFIVDSVEKELIWLHLGILEPIDKTPNGIITFKAFINPGSTGGSPLQFFRYICQTNGAINAKLAAPFGPSMLHAMCKYKFRIYHRWAVNDVRVTSWSGDLMQNKNIQESLLWTQFLSLNQFIWMKWRRFARPTELLYLIFKILKKKNKYYTLKNDLKNGLSLNPE